MTLQEMEDENTAAARRGDPALLFALLEWARRTRDGVSEAELRESRERYAAQATKGALPALRGAQAEAKRGA